MNVRVYTEKKGFVALLIKVFSEFRIISPKFACQTQVNREWGEGGGGGFFLGFAIKTVYGRRDWVVKLFYTQTKTPIMIKYNKIMDTSHARYGKKGLILGVKTCHLHDWRGTKKTKKSKQ